MKTIGLIGGMSWESTLTYYQIINEAVKRELGAFIRQSFCWPAWTLPRSRRASKEAIGRRAPGS